MRSLAHGSNSFVAGLQIGVGLIDGEGKLEVFEGVFVGAPDAGVVGEGADFAEGVDHLGGGAFKESATASGKEGVAAEEFAGFVGVGGGKVVGDVGFGVSGDEEDLGGAIGEGDVIAFLKEDLLTGNSTAIVFTAIYSGVGEFLEEAGISTHVISVMVGVEDGDEFGLKLL